jgi:hypothetical protein
MEIAKRACEKGIHLDLFLFFVAERRLSLARPFKVMTYFTNQGV